MMVNCAVCELEIDERDAFATIDDDGEVYYLCSGRCLEEFEEEPELFGAWALEEAEGAERR
jgi:YHS domain-containing protein